MWKKVFTALRDLVLLGIGAWGIYKEATSDTPSAEIILVYVLVATSPGTLAAMWLGRSGGSTSTDVPSSQPPPLPPSSGPRSNS